MPAQLTTPNIDLIKLVAITTMAIDHINTIILEGKYHSLQLIGRVAFPLFIYILVYNYYHHTRNIGKYLLRIFFFAVIAQPIYILAFNIPRLNILFTLGIGLLLIEWFRQSRYHYLVVAILFLVLYASTFYGYEQVLDFGFRSLFLIFCLGLYFETRRVLFMLLTLISVYFLNANTFIPAQAFITTESQLGLAGYGSLIAILPSFILKINLRHLMRFRFLFYAFYPAHLLILYLLRAWF